MQQNTYRRPKRLILMITCIVVVLLMAIGLSGLIRNRNHQDATQPTRAATSRPRPEPSPASTARPSNPAPTASTATRPMPAQIANTVNPERFARSAAMALFNWDTTLGYQPADLAQAVVAAGDPTGVETGLASDVRSYVPTDNDWNYLRGYQTKQWLTIKRAYVPHGWAIALAQAKPGQLRPGTVAYTIIGTRHRTGIWLTQPVSTDHSVAFTLIITCRPTFDACRLLRVGKLNSPLN